MGSRGPAPTPLKLLKARGSWRGDINKSPPEPKAGKPPCPAWLSKEAKATYRKLCTILHDEMAVLTIADQNALARYAHFFNRWLKAEAWIEEHGDTYPIRKIIKDEEGRDQVVALGFKLFPKVKVAAQLSAELHRLEQQFGLTPSARARLTTMKDQEPESNGKARFFKDAAG